MEKEIMFRNKAGFCMVHKVKRCVNMGGGKFMVETCEEPENEGEFIGVPVGRATFLVDVENLISI